jgi:hypothetical protein
MSAPNCPHCDGTGRLATNVLFDLYRCTRCRKEYWVDHATCGHPNCASWVDHEASGLCWYHAAQHGIHPDDAPKDPSLCNATDCTRERVEGDLCQYHAWEAQHTRDEQ